MSLGIDWVNHQILVESPQTTLVLQDLINYIREQEATDIGMGQGSIAGATGKEDLGNSVSVGITVNLNTPWQVKFWEGSYVAIISGGNLVGGLAGQPVAYTAGVQVLIIQSAASTIVSTGGSALTTTEHDQLAAINSAVATYLDAAISTRSATGAQMALTNAAVDSVLDEPVEGAYTLRQIMRLVVSALAAKLSGAATASVTIRDVNDTKDRITATVDADGNRTAVTLDAS